MWDFWFGRPLERCFSDESRDLVERGQAASSVTLSSWGGERPHGSDCLPTFQTAAGFHRITLILIRAVEKGWR